MGTLQHIKLFDRELFLLINKKWNYGWMESLIPWFRYQQVWYPFYLFLVVFAWINFGKRGLIWLAGLIGTIALSDNISSRLVKNLFRRLRPCSDPELAPLANLRLPHCAGGFSFTSSHAANHFAIAMFLFLTFYPIAGKKAGWIFLWSLLVGYAQVYVGVHYPMDIIGGALLGSGIGWLGFRPFSRDRYRLLTRQTI